MTRTGFPKTKEKSKLLKRSPTKTEGDESTRKGGRPKGAKGTFYEATGVTWWAQLGCARSRWD